MILLNVPFDEWDMKSLKVVYLYEFIQIHTEAFTSNTQMVSEIEMIRHFHVMMSILWIL